MSRYSALIVFTDRQFIKSCEEIGTALEDDDIDGTAVVSRLLGAAIQVHMVEIASPDHLAGALGVLQRELQPDIVYLVGSGAALPSWDANEVPLAIGSVLVASKLYAIESGVSGGTFRPNPVSTPVSYSVDQAVRLLLRRDVLGGSAVGVGAVASGTVHVDSPEAPILQNLKQHYPDAVALIPAVWTGAGVLQQFNQKLAVILGITHVLGEPERAEMKSRAVNDVRRLIESLLLHFGRRADVSPGAEPGRDGTPEVLPVELAPRRPTPGWAKAEHEKLARQRDELRQLLKQLRGNTPEVQQRRIALNGQIRALNRHIYDGPQLAPGCLLGERYELLEAAGAGSFGTVWRAWDEVEQIDVALKVLHSHLAGDRTSRDRFLNGARRLQKIKHRHIIGLREIPDKDDDGFYYLIMDWVDGRYREAVPAITPEERLRLLVGVAEALYEAHEAGIVHRDIKPDNILLADDGTRALLCDFELAHAQGTIPYTRMGILGTFGYAAPEQLQDSARVGPPADQYGLGRVGMMALTARDPPPCSSDSETIRYLRLCRAPSKIKLVLARATAIDASQRFRDMRDFAQALGRALDDASTAGHWQERSAATTLRAAAAHLAKMPPIEVDAVCSAIGLPIDRLPPASVSAHVRCATLVSQARRHQVTDELLARLQNFTAHEAALPREISWDQTFYQLCELGDEQYHAQRAAMELDPLLVELITSHIPGPIASQIDVCYDVVKRAVVSGVLDLVQMTFSGSAVQRRESINWPVIRALMIDLALDLLWGYGVTSPDFHALRRAMRGDPDECVTIADRLRVQIIEDARIKPEALSVLLKLSDLAQERPRRLSAADLRVLTRLDDKLVRDKLVYVLCALDEAGFTRLVEQSGLRLVVPSAFVAARLDVVQALIARARAYGAASFLEPYLPDGDDASPGASGRPPRDVGRIDARWHALSPDAQEALGIALRDLSEDGSVERQRAVWSLLCGTPWSWPEIAEMLGCERAFLPGPGTPREDGLFEVVTNVVGSGLASSIAKMLLARATREIAVEDATGATEPRDSAQDSD